LVENVKFQMDSSLLELLNKCQQYNVSSSSPETHFTFFSPTKGWTIPNDMICDFWYTYCSKVYNDIDGPYYIGEKVETKMDPAVPLTALLSFKFEKQGLDIYNVLGDDFKTRLISSFQSVIEEMLNCESKDDREFICCYYENQTPTITENYVTLKIRLQFPLCPVQVSIQRDHLQPRIATKLRVDNVVGFMSAQSINGWNEIIDMSFKEAIPLYGSRKESTENALILNEIYPKLSFNDDNHFETIDLNQLYEYISNHRDILNDNVPIDAIEDWIAENDNEVGFILPMFLSMWFPKGQVSLKRSGNATGQITSMSKKTVSLNPIEDLCQKLLNLLSSDRFKKRNYWLDIGRGLLNCFKNQDLALELWKGWSLRHGGPNESECEHNWNLFRDERLSIKTIAWYAKEDNKHDYELLMKSFCDNLKEKSLSLGHTDIAEALYYQVMWLNVVFDSKEWYRFENHRWIKCEGGIIIRNMITKDFIKVFVDWRKEITMKQSEDYDDNNDNDSDDGPSGKKSKTEEKLEKIGKIISKLKDVRFRGNIMKALEEVIHVENFRKLIDTNPGIIGVANGVIEISEGEALFRPGKPEDFITMCTSTRYNTQMTYEHPIVQKLEKWMNQMFTDKELNRHFKKDCASFLYGKNAEKIFRIYSGSGDNSKSMLMKLLQLCLGSYCCDLPITMITGQRTQSDAPSPALAQTKGTHIGFLSEPDGNSDKINAGTVKAMTGGDRFFARSLNDNGGSIEATFKMILTCNRIPAMVGDKALHNRVRVIPFMSSWVDNPPATEEEQYKQGKFKKDSMFEKSLAEMAPAMLWMMVQFYPVYYSEGLSSDPEIVKEMTSKYWSEVDTYDNFISEKLLRVFNDEEKKILDETRYITATEMYTAFKTYFASSFGKNNMPSAPIVRSELTNRLGPMKGNRWIGLVVNEEEE
jgi:phage/plasmid-associated DNA primase